MKHHIRQPKLFTSEVIRILSSEDLHPLFNLSAEENDQVLDAIYQSNFKMGATPKIDKLIERAKVL